MAKMSTKYSTYEEFNLGQTVGITARAGGGQALATALTKKWNRVDTCAADYDSTKLLAAQPGLRQVVTNTTAKTLSVYPQSNEYINGIQNYRLDIPPGMTFSFEALEGTKWLCYHVGDLSSLVFSVRRALSSAEILTLNTVPIDIVTAPGAGYALKAYEGCTKYTKGAAKFTSGGQTGIISAGAPTSDFQLSMPANFTSTANFFSNMYQQGFNTGAIQENQKLRIFSQANYANGNGSAVIHVLYRILKV